MELWLNLRLTTLILILLYHTNLSESTDSKHTSTPTSQDSTSGSQPKPAADGSQSSNPTTNNDTGNTKRTGVVLDINSKKSTDQYTHNVNNKLHTYEAKESYAFNKVYEKKTIGKDKDIWITTDSKPYAKKVEYDENNNTVTLTLLNDSTKKFQKIGTGCCGCCNKTWNQIVTVTSSGEQNKSKESKPSSSNVKIFTLDEGSSQPKENDTNKYELKEDDANFFSYKFKNDAKCVEIKYDDLTAWKHDDQNNKEEYPKALYFHKDLKFFFFDLGNDLFYLYRLTKSDNKDEWLFYSVKKVDQDFQKQIIVTIKDGTKAAYKDDQHTPKELPFALEVSPNEGVKIIQISYCSKELKDVEGHPKTVNSTKLWQHDDNKLKENYPKAFYIFEHQNYIVVFDNFYIVSIANSKKGKKHEVTTSASTPAPTNQSATPASGGTNGSQGTTPESGGSQPPTNPPTTGDGSTTNPSPTGTTTSNPASVSEPTTPGGQQSTSTPTTN